MRSFLASRFELPDYAGRIVPLEGMRGMAALIVFLVHFRALFQDRNASGSFLSWATKFGGSFGHTGVDVFFLLSGFLVYGIVMRSNFRYGSYLLRRVGRLYPTFLIVLLAYLVLSVAFPEHAKLPRSLPESLVYILANLAMLPGIFNIRPIIEPAWSLSYEMLFYVTMPVMIFALGVRRWRPLHRISFLLLLAAVHVVLCGLGISAHIRMIMFAAGAILWEVGRYPAVTQKLNPWSEYLAIAAFCVNLAVIGSASSGGGSMTLVMTRVPVMYSLSLFVTVFFLTLHTVFFGGLLSSIFSWDYLRWVGNMSYSYYLIHGLAMHGIWMLVNPPFLTLPRTAFWFVALFVVCVMASLVCAAILFLWVEKPISLEKRTTRQANVGEPVNARR